MQHEQKMAEQVCQLLKERRVERSKAAKTTVT